MKKNVLFLAGVSVLVFSFLFLNPNLAKKDDLRLIINLEKETFLVSEPIWLDIYMENSTGEKVEVKPLTTAAGWFKIVLTNSENDTIPYRGETIEWVGEGPTILIAPKETLYVCRNLLEGTGFGEIIPGMTGQSYLQMNTYKIKTLYTYKGILLESNELTFKVVNPNGVEQDAYLLLDEGCKNYGKRKWDLTIQKWKELLEKYPKSVYAPRICWELSGIYEFAKNDPKNSKFYKRELFSDYPNSGYAQYVIGVLVENKSAEEAKNLLTEIERKYAGKRAEKFIRNFRRGIKTY